MSDRIPWQERGLCHAMPEPDPIFFPTKRGERAAAEAKAICVECPVMLTCGQWAIEHRERYGIWGGMSERAREKLYRGR